MHNTYRLFRPVNVNNNYDENTPLSEFLICVRCMPSTIGAVCECDPHKPYIGSCSMAL